MNVSIKFIIALVTILQMSCTPEENVYTNDYSNETPQATVGEDGTVDPDDDEE